MKDEVTEAIEQYRAQVTAEAELARGDLAEIEDHLRALIDDLRATGMPATAAIAEAARRLGDPKQVAREHARVRTPFGAKLSRWRSWSVAALLAIPLAAFGYETLPHVGPWSHEAAQFALGAVLVVAFALRLSWARPIALGGVAFFTVLSALSIATSRDSSVLWLVPFFGLLAFLVPWRRGELGPAGGALVLQVWALGAAISALGFMMTTPAGVVHVSSAAQIGFATAMISLAGGIVRARWGALASLVAATMLVVLLAQVLPLHYRMRGGELYAIAIPLLVATGSVAAAIAALLAWRSARSNLGSLRGLLS